MVERFFQIKDFVKEFVDEDEPLADVFSAIRRNEITALEDLRTKLTNLQSVTTRLQRRDLTLLDARRLFDHTLKHFPTMAGYLDADAAIAHSPVFESAIIRYLKVCLLIILCVPLAKS
jgi:hypothetical protein